MASISNKDLIRNLTAKATMPLVFRSFVSDWNICQWNEQKWSSIFGEKEMPFRCLRRDIVSDEPCWERRCGVKSLTFQEFLSKLSGEEWMYFDYKYLHQWLSAESELYKELSWSQFGYPEKGAMDTTLWVGSKGAHTPCHQDTYGFNIVAQVYGRKCWILFPPETGGFKPTRVPYEESSIYSRLNFYCPTNLNQFKGLTGGCMVELSAGDALLVPRDWWHYVQNIDPLNISVNIWLPHEKDTSAQVSEALIKILVAQLCKDLPQQTAKLLVNPNEDDISDTPLTVLFLQLEAVVKAYIDKKRKMHRVKRQKTRDDDQEVACSESCDVKTLVDNPDNKLEIVASVTSDNIIDFIKANLKEFANTDMPADEDETDGTIEGLCLTKAVIDAFSQSNVIELVKQNLLAQLTSS